MMKDIKRSRVSRTMAVGGTSLALAIAALAVAPHVIGSDASPSTGALGLGPVSVVSAPGQGVDLPGNLAMGLAAVEEVVPGSARLVVDAAGAELYVLDSRQAGRFCVVASGKDDFFSVSCAPVAAVATGKYGVPLPLGTGRPTPYVYFGIVPDGVVSVGTAQGVASVARNAFTLSHTDGSPLGILRFTKADGTTISVDPVTTD